MNSSKTFSDPKLKIRVSLEDMRNAQSIISPVVENTALIKSPHLSEIHGFNVFIKPENLQTTGAFKIRGAYNKISKLSKNEKSMKLTIYSFQ